MTIDQEAQVLDVSVVIPTIGRPIELRTTLESLAACRPRPAEIIVVDQSHGDEVVATVAEFPAGGAKVVRSAGRGIPLAVNEGLRNAVNETVLATHDDCSVAPDWIAVGYELASAAPACVFTGRVLPEGDAENVPSTKDDPNPHDFTGELTCQALYPSNMVLPRSTVLAFGGFDERFRTAAEDNDYCYRWLKAGHCLRYDPALVVWHRDWRTPNELKELYVRYWREQGRFYAKHLRRGDTRMVRLLMVDIKYVVAVTMAGVLASLKGQRFQFADEPRGLFRGLLPGLVRGWREFKAP